MIVFVLYGLFVYTIRKLCAHNTNNLASLSKGQKLHYVKKENGHVNPRTCERLTIKDIFFFHIILRHLGTKFEKLDRYSFGVTRRANMFSAVRWHQ